MRLFFTKFVFVFLTMLAISRRVAGFSLARTPRAFVLGESSGLMTSATSVLGGREGRRGFRTSSSLMASLKTAIVGMPNVGKSTLFNALTETQGALAANYPFATIEPNIGIVEVPDAR